MICGGDFTVVWDPLSDEMAFEKKQDGCEGANFTKFWGKKVIWRRICKCKDPEVRTNFTSSPSP